MVEKVKLYISSPSKGFLVCNGMLKSKVYEN